MPLPIMLAYKLIQKRDELAKKLTYLRSDAKTQVTVAYDQNLNPLYVSNIIISTQHAPNTSIDVIKMLDLLRPIYLKTYTGGHFGREDADFTWEKLDKVGAILEQVAQQKK